MRHHYVTHTLCMYFIYIEAIYYVYHRLIHTYFYSDVHKKHHTNIIVYPFSLTSPNTQPHGSINSSRIKSFQLDLNVNSLPANTFYQYQITVYVESLNWVTISSGMGGLKYAL